MKNRLRVLRAESDWTQAELAKRVGVSRQAIIAIEGEKFDPSLPLAMRIARIFGASVEEVFLLEGDSVGPGDNGKGGASDPPLP
jgi:putative transcriptional regulator